tara:strand:+ start:2868 stop:3587 length:720 start_codon:yes stop_codon:yes gene_type:complete
MNKKVIYFLISQGILIMVYKKIILLALFLCFSINIYGKVLYEKQDLVITDIDVEIYKKIYESNYGSPIGDNNALKELVLINNVLKYLEYNNKEFLDRIDSEITLQYEIEIQSDVNLRNFLRFSKVRDEFIINYFKNELDIDEIVETFSKLESLNLPVSRNDCLIIDKIIDLKDNKKFTQIYLDNLRNNTRDFNITLFQNDYKVCIDDMNFRLIEQLIIEYIETQTEEEFKYFVYGKTKN